MITTQESKVNTNLEHEEWRNIAEASKEIKVSRNKLSRMVSRGRIKSKKNPRDERETLVDLVELRKIFPPLT
jgi:hypothetical protein